MKSLFNILRVAIAIVLLVWLLTKVNIKESLLQLRNANLLFLLLAMVVFLGLILISVWRWKIILDARNQYFTTNYLIKVYFACCFFNNILPTSIGGDVIRVIYTIKENNKTLAFSATLVDRMIGFVGLFFFALCASLLLLILKQKTSFLLLNVFGFLILILIVLVLFSDRAHQLFSRIFRHIKLFRIGEIFEKVYTAVKEYRRFKMALLVSFLLSILLQADQAVTWYLAGYAVGARVSVFYYFLYIPIVGLLTMIPLTIGGLGIRENSFVAFFSNLGVAGAVATSTSLLFLIINFIYALIGGIVFLFLKRSKEKKERYDVTISQTKPGESQAL